jgi:protein involved in polysaccharide export with SLBB domain
METIMNNPTLVKSGAARRWAQAGVLALLFLLPFIWAGCQTPPMDSPKDDKIILREGDVLSITFPGSTNLDTTQTIRRDGKISLPLVGEVYAVDVTPDELQEKLIKLFDPQISSKEITVTVQSSSYPVYVTGSVERPGKIQADQPISAVEAVMEAGGFDYARANMRKVRIIRHTKGKTQSFVLDLKAVMDGKDIKQFYLRPNDIIYVPEKFTWF